MAQNYGWVQGTPLGKKLDNHFKQLIESKFIDKIKQVNVEVSGDGDYRDEFYLKWYRSYFYICCKYKNGNGDVFDDKVARIAFYVNDTASTAYMRHTGSWWTINESMSIDDAVEEVLNNDMYWN